jgi:hypothetical protein
MTMSKPAQCSIFCAVFSNRYVLLQACEELGGNRIAYG